MKIGRVIVHPLRLPLPYEDLEGAAPVAAALDTPIASGATEYGWLGMKRYLDARAADILMPDLQRMGGSPAMARRGTGTGRPGPPRR